MQVSDFQAQGGEVIGQILTHLLCQGCDQNTLLLDYYFTDLSIQILHLPFGGTNINLWVEQPGGSDNLLDDSCTLGKFTLSGCRRDIDALLHHLFKLGSLQGPVVQCGGSLKP